MFSAFAIAIAIVAGILAMKLIFGFAGGLIGLLLSVAWLALKLLVFAGVAYWVLTLIAPELARKIRDRVQGTSTI